MWPGATSPVRAAAQRTASRKCSPLLFATPRSSGPVSPGRAFFGSAAMPCVRAVALRRGGTVVLRRRIAAVRGACGRQGRRRGHGGKEERPSFVLMYPIYGAPAPGATRYGGIVVPLRGASPQFRSTFLRPRPSTGRGRGRPAPPDPLQLVRPRLAAPVAARARALPRSRAFHAPRSAARPRLPRPALA